MHNESVGRAVTEELQEYKEAIKEVIFRPSMSLITVISVGEGVLNLTVSEAIILYGILSAIKKGDCNET